MRLMFIILLLSSYSFAALAQTLITCGASSGHAYFLDQGPIPKTAIGWSEDKISQGSFSLVKNGEALDLLYKDATGNLASSRSDGGRVILLGSNDTNTTVLVAYDGVTAELWTFDFVNKLAVWSQHKYGGLINKAATFVSKCQ